MPTAPSSPRLLDEEGEDGPTTLPQPVEPMDAEPADAPGPDLAARKQQLRQMVEQRQPAAPQRSELSALATPQGNAAAFRAEQQGRDDAIHEQAMAEREATVAQRRQQVAQQKATNASRLAEFKSTGQQHYKDPYGNYQPVIEAGTNRPLYDTTNWEDGGVHPKTGEPTLVKRDQYGQRQYKSPPIVAGTDPHDTQLYYKFGEDDLRAAGDLTAMKAHQNPQVARLAQQTDARRRQAMWKEALLPMEEAKNAVEVEYDAATQRKLDLQGQIEQVTQQMGAIPEATLGAKSGGFFGIGGTPTPEATAAQGQKAALDQRMQALVLEQADLDEKLKPMGALGRMKRNSQLDLAIFKAKATHENYGDLAEERRDILRQQGKDEATDPILKSILTAQKTYGDAVQRAARVVEREAGVAAKQPQKFETPLSTAEEQQFQQWKAENAPQDSGADYDLRGAFKAGATQDANGHWPDTFKKPNHPTFSDQSIYAKDAPDKAGHWEGDKFTPADQLSLQQQWAKAGPLERAKMMMGKRGFGPNEVEGAVPMIGSEAAGTKGGAFTIPKMQGTGTGAGIINAANKFTAGLTTPENAAILAATGGTGALAEAAAGTKVALTARAAETAAMGVFTGVMAKDTVTAAGEARKILADPKATDADKADAVTSVGLAALMTGASAAGTRTLAGKTAREARGGEPPPAGAPAAPKSPTPDPATLDRLAKIAEMPPEQAEAEFAKLEAEFSNETKTSAARTPEAQPEAAAAPVAGDRAIATSEPVAAATEGAGAFVAPQKYSTVSEHATKDEAADALTERNQSIQSTGNGRWRVVRPVAEAPALDVEFAETPAATKPVASAETAATSRKPLPETARITIQEPQGDVPGYQQVDMIGPGGESTGSFSPQQLREQGYEVPKLAGVKTGQYGADLKAIGKQAETKPAATLATTEASAPVAETTPKEDRFQKMLRVAFQRAADESRAQAILDDMEAVDRSPNQVVTEFWRDTYDKLPDDQKRKFEKYIQRETGMEPGDVIATHATEPPVIGKTWQEIYPDSANEVGHLEGTERGLIALMETANQIVKRTPSESAPASLEAPKRTLESIKADRAKRSSEEIASAKKTAGEAADRANVEQLGGRDNYIAQVRQRIDLASNAQASGWRDRVARYEQNIKRAERLFPASDEPTNKVAPPAPAPKSEPDFLTRFKDPKAKVSAREIITNASEEGGSPEQAMRDVGFKDIDRNLSMQERKFLVDELDRRAKAAEVASPADSSNRATLARDFEGFPKGTEVTVGQRGEGINSSSASVTFPDGKSRNFPLAWLKSSAERTFKTLPDAIAKLGRERVADLAGEFGAELGPDGKSITSFADPRNQTGRGRASTREFLEWMDSVEGREVMEAGGREAKAAPETKSIAAKLPEVSSPETSPELTPPAQMKPAARIAELEANGVGAVNGKPLKDANAAELINALGKLRRGVLEEPKAGAPLSDRAIAALQKAKIGKPGRVLSADPFTLAYDGAIELAILGIRAGRKAAEVIKLAVDRFKARYPKHTPEELARVEEAVRGAIAEPAPAPTEGSKKKSLLPESLKAAGAPAESIEYEVRQQDARKQEASSIIQKEGPAKAEEMMVKSDLPGDTRVAIGGQLINERMLALAEAKPEEVARIAKDIQRITAKMQPELATAAGQQISMFGGIYKDVRVAAASEYIRTETKKRVDAMGGPEVEKAAQEAADAFNKTKDQKAREAAIEKLKEKYTTAPVRKTLDQLKRIEATKHLNDLGVLTREDMIEAAGNALGLPGISAKKLQHLAGLADKITNAKNHAERSRAELDLAAALNVYKGVEAMDVASSLLTANILSGYTTQAANIEGNALNLVGQLASTAAVNPTKLGPLVKGFLDGLPLARDQAKSIWQTGRGTRDFQDKTAGAGSVLSTVDFARDFPKVPKLAGDIATTGTRVVDRIFRFMKAADAVFYYPAREAYARLVATKLLEGDFKGSELDTKVSQLLQITPAAFESARRQATMEGYEGVDLGRRVADIIEERRATDANGKMVVKESERFAAETTYTNEPEGLAGVAYHALKYAVQEGRIGKVPVLKPWVMFLKTPANVFNTTLNYTPVGAVRAHFGMRGAGFRNAEWRNFTKDERQRLYLQSVVGTAIMGAMVSRILDKDDADVSAQGPEDAAKRAQLRNAGWSPYSIRSGDKWISYKDSPLLVPLAIVGHVADSIKYNSPQKDVPLEQRVAEAVASSPQTIFQTSMLTGLADLMGALSGKGGAGVGRTLGSIPANLVIPYNRLLQQVDQSFDPQTYDNPPVVGGVPFVRRTGEPLTDVQGRPQQYSPMQRFGSSESKDPVDSLIRDKQIFIPDVGRDVKLGNTTMTDQQRDAYRRISGQRIRIRLQAIAPRLRVLTQEKAQDEITAIAREEREKVKPLIRAGVGVKR